MTHTNEHDQDLRELKQALDIYGDFKRMPAPLVTKFEKLVSTHPEAKTLYQQVLQTRLQLLPNSQGDLRYPDEHDREHFHANAMRMTGDPGDCVIFNGMCWHCAMPNVSADVDRTGVLIEYLPKFVAPLEDLRRGVRADVVERATPMLRQLMALEYPYPEILDDNTGEATIGRDVDADSHSALDG